MFSVLVLFILQHFLYCYLLTSLSVGAKVDHSKSAFACDPFDLIFVLGRDWFSFLVDGDAGLVDLIRLSLHDLILMCGFIGVDFEIATIGGSFLGDVFWININEFRFRWDLLTLLKLVFRLLYLGNDTAVYLFVRVTLFLLRMVVIE